MSTDFSIQSCTTPLQKKEGARLVPTYPELNDIEQGINLPLPEVQSKLTAQIAAALRPRAESTPFAQSVKPQQAMTRDASTQVYQKYESLKSSIIRPSEFNVD